ncbi:MAG: hypothetical protein II007_13615 [Gammaproteobacteria bacterium]|nr:hypothetical protein [Gammaproteobacteria bacterium]
MSRKIAGWIVERDENDCLIAVRESDKRNLHVVGSVWRDIQSRSLDMFLTDLLTEAAPEPATAVTDRKLADAVNELRDIAIKYHAAGQLRERIAGVVHGLVRAESAPAVIGFDPAAPDGSGRLLAGGE